jgi:hypothetical protein
MMKKCRVYRCFLPIVLFWYWCYNLRVKEINMKNQRITKALSKGKKMGYYKPKAKQMRLKAIIQAELETLDY